MDQTLHSLQVASAQSGVTPFVIRVWEKRYGAVTPARTAGNQRLFSDEEIERLRLLRLATEGGYRIGLIANAPIEQLRELAKGLDNSGMKESPEGDSSGHSSEAAAIATSSRITKRKASKRFQPTTLMKPVLDECVAAIREFDTARLEAAFDHSSTVLGGQGMLQHMIAPLVQAIGTLWRSGEITAAHEHFASSAIKIFLGHATRSFAGSDGAPVIVVTTPSGQLHELGALLVGATASNLGWRVAYLGASLPAAEIAGACIQQNARAVALSIVYPEDDASLNAELLKLRTLLPPEVPVLAGGRAMSAYSGVLKQIHAICSEDLASFGLALDGLRQVRS